METKQSNARYTIGTVTSKDESLIKRYKELAKTGETHESIYIAGLEALEGKKSS